MRNPKTITYAFNPASRTIDFAGTPGFDVRNLAGVIHPTGALLYFPGDPTTGLDLSRTSGTVVALVANCSAFGASDPLICLYEDGTTPLGADAARESKQDAQSVLLTAIRDALLAQRSETIWTDDSGVRYVRIDKGGSISWTDLSGNASSAPGAGARPDSDSGTVVTHQTYRATAAATGYGVGDLLDHIIVTDGDAGDLVSNFWLNVISGAKIAAPPASDITVQAPLPDGAATVVLQQQISAALTSILGGIGTPTDPAPTTDGANASLIGLFRRGLGYLGALAGALKNGALSVFTPSLDAIGSLSAANDAVSTSCAGRNTVVIEVPAGGWTGSIVIEGSALGDFSDTVTLTTRTFGAGSTASAAAITTSGTYDANVTGLAAVRARANGTITGGPVSVLVRAAAGLKSLRVHAPATDPLPVQTTSSVAVSDAAGAIAAGGTATPLAANAVRQILVITNTGSNPMSVRFNAAATATAGHIIAPGANLTFDDKCPTGSVNLFSTSGTTFFVTSG